MSAQARVVVIGGGVVGASVLYHLALRGWTDCLLLEMDELTSGSTWHAAGNVPTFSGDRNVMRLQHYGTRLYEELAADPERPIAYHKSGSLRLAQTRGRLDEFRHVAAMANSLGLGYELLTPSAARERHPFLETDGLAGVLWDPNDGDIDPSQLTQALAAAARALGARVKRFARVTALERTATKEWRVRAGEETVTAEYLVNAGGYRGAEVAALAGRFLPLVALEHQYLVTEPVAALAERRAAGAAKLPLLRDPDDSWYLRQEKDGLILGPYERRATPRWTDGKIPERFAYELYADDLERLEWHVERACERVPILAEGGVQRVVNGPIPYSPDGLPYVGPAFGLPNFFHCCGFSFGICQGGGAGKSLAEWIVDGRPEWDLWSLDPRRYGDFATQEYVVARAVEVYRNEYAAHFPAVEWPAGRPTLEGPLRARLAARGARFGARGGWERATWFRRGADPAETLDQPFAEAGFDGIVRDADAAPRPIPGAGYARGAWSEAVGEECLRVRDAAGLIDLPGFTRFDLAGPGAAAWLDTLVAGRLPAVGRVALAYLCHPSGGVWSEMTVTRLAADDFLLVSAAAARHHDMQWLEEHRPADARFRLEDLSEARDALVLAGPASREILAAVTDADLADAAFPWLAARSVSVAGVDEVLALRVNYVGELGWELHLPVARAEAVYDALRDAGNSHGLGDVGMYAMDALRLEKSYRAWKLELDHALSPFASGLDRFVALDKGVDFVGRAALAEEQARGGPAERFATMILDEAGDTDAFFGCPVHHAGEAVGMVTSGAYGHRVGASIALGYLRPDLALPGTAVELEVVGARRAARVVAESPWDPQNARLRG